MQGVEYTLYSLFDGLEELLRMHWRFQTFMIIFPFFILLDLPRYFLTRLIVFLTGFDSEHSYDTKFRDWAINRLHHENPLVSVIVPALNEEDTILNTVRSLREQTYRNLQIIISDDASTDGTQAICEDLARRGEIVYVRNENRGGKSSALNHALQYATGTYVIGIDSDTLFQRDAFENILYHFYDENVAAVGGCLRVLNYNHNVVTSLQSMEYLLSIATGRRFRAKINTLFIISGAFGAFRRDLLLSVRGYSQGPGEDSDITAKMRKKKMQIRFAHDAICYTKVPTSLWALIRQRYRWNTSIIKIKVRKHGNIINPEWDTFTIQNLIGWLDIIFFQVVLTITFIVFTVGFLSYAPYTFVKIMVIFHIISSFVLTVEMFIAWALNGRRKEDLKLFPYIPLFGFYKGYFIRLVRASAYISESLFRVSYRLPFVPSRVRLQAEKW